MAHLVSMKKGKYSDSFFTYHNIPDDVIQKERQAAILIQSWFRSTKVQKHLQYLHECAEVIQRRYRAYLARRFYRCLVQRVMSNYMKAYYDKMASIIQARWRGYYVRKYKADFYSRKEYLNALVAKNQHTLSLLKEVEMIDRFNKEKQQIEKEEASRLYSYRKNHYLLSTKVCKGIYNSPATPHCGIEGALQASLPLSQQERDEVKRRKHEKYLTSSVGIQQDISQIPKTASLPPIIPQAKPQGPFRNPEDVRKQRYKELCPSLRVATDYKSVEEARSQMYRDEWTKRIIDQPFLPSTKRTNPYQPTLHTSSSFGSLDYGTKHFRDEQTEKVIHAKPFQRVVSPIPLFDHLGKSY